MILLLPKRLLVILSHIVFICIIQLPLRLATRVLLLQLLHHLLPMVLLLPLGAGVGVVVVGGSSGGIFVRICSDKESAKVTVELLG